MTTQTPPVNDLLAQLRAYLECLTHIHVDPRCFRRFGWSDIVQITMMEAWKELKAIQALDGPAQQREVRRMFRNNLLDRIRHEQAARRDYRREQPPQDSLEASSASLLPWLEDDEPTPLEKMTERERALVLAAAMAQLPERQREALILQRWHGWKLREIAEHLECKTNAVAGLLAHGMTKLRKLVPDDLLD